MTHCSIIVRELKQFRSWHRYGVFVQSAEEFTIVNNYIGGQSVHNVYLTSSSADGGIGECTGTGDPHQ